MARRVTAVDRHVGARMYERRKTLGLTQQRMAAQIGVTTQQAAKYEKGVNCITAGRLYGVACALGVDVGYFFEGLDDEATSPDARLVELLSNFTKIDYREYQAALGAVARALAGSKEGAA